MGSSPKLVADYYRVSHISVANTPSSRLNDILVRMYEGRQLTKNSLDFLQRQNLPGLYRLACGEITHDAYVAGLDPDYLNRYQVAKDANQAKEAERQSLAAHYIARRTIHPASGIVEEAKPSLRRKREREASEAVLKAQKARQAEWKAQRECNCELAAVAYISRANTPGYTEPTALDLARYFHLEHVAAAVCPPMSDLLEALFRGRPLTGEELTDLRHSALDDLYRLAFGQLSLEGYIPAAKAAETTALERAARVQRQVLYEKYGVSLTDKSMIPRMTMLLQQIDAGNRPPQEEWAWLSTSAKKYFSAPLRKTYHRLEADFHADQYLRTQDPWEAVNASKHYRKCDQSAVALELIDNVAPDHLKQPKVRSAVLTTRGGALRDLGRQEEAIQMGEIAHALMPKDYYPCTLLGAVHMERHDFEKGHEWYEKARNRGAPEEDIDPELRSIYQKLGPDGRKSMERALLAEGSHRYSWLKEAKSQQAKKQSGSGDR